MTDPRIRVAIRSALTRCARDLGLPEGCAPSQPKYTAWSLETGAMTAYRMARLVAQGRAPWRAVVRFAGLRPMSEVPRKAGRQAVIDDLRRVAFLIGRPEHIPAPLAYREHGRFSANTVIKTLCRDSVPSWHNAAVEAGLKSNRRRNNTIDPDQIVGAFRRLAKQLGYTPGGYGPTAAQFRDYVCHPRTVSRWFPSYADLVRAAGFVPRPLGVNRGREPAIDARAA